MQLTLGISPCPNDTFIFEALIHQKIDTEGLTFKTYYEDVETLNQWAFQSRLSVTKLSYFAFAHLTSSYVLLGAGSALGFGVGPLVIAKPSTLNQIKSSLFFDKIQQTYRLVKPLRVAIPGRYTTANFLFNLAIRGEFVFEERLFSTIEDAVVDGEVDLGLIIHENRFTYESKGLVQLLDLGEFWERQHQQAIPLGGIVVSRSLPFDVQHKVARVVERSVRYALENPSAGMDFVRSYAQNMDDEVIKNHIQLYVNDYSVSLGSVGKAAVSFLLEKAKTLGLIGRYEEHFLL